MTDNSLYAVLAEQLLLGVAAIAGMRQKIKGDSARLDNLEKKSDALSAEYIPRRELQAILAAIEKTAAHTNALVMALISSGGDRQVALRAIEAAEEVGGIESLEWLEPYLQTQLPRFEGRCSYFYLDTKGNVTIGCGTMVPDPAAALRLPLRTRAGEIATPQEILSDYTRVSKMARGHLATFYRSVNSLTLTLDETVELDRSRCLAFIAQLRAEFAGFDSFPVSAKIGLVDMIYNMGLGRAPEDGRDGEGLLGFVRFCADVRLRNWVGAAAECIREAKDPAFDARNAWTRAQFLAAAKEPVL